MLKFIMIVTSRENAYKYNLTQEHEKYIQSLSFIVWLCMLLLL